MTLFQKTKEVVKDSIRSAIFIDEKAVEFFTNKPNFHINEEKLSAELYSDFKTNGISLDIHRFNVADIEKDDLIPRVVNKDLVLLDWDLDHGVSGNKYALEILSKIVDQSHIHFCCIYTSSSDIDYITDRIKVYFSGKDFDYYQNIFDMIVDPYYDQNKSLFDKISIENPSNNATLIQEIKKIDKDLTAQIQDSTGIKNICDALIQVKYAILGFLIRKEKYHLSKTPLHIAEHVNKLNRSLNINNTIVTVIEKECNSSNAIIDKLCNQIERSENALMALIGLDMQNNFAKQSSFIDKNLLDVHEHALLHHRKKLNEASGSEFQVFIRSVLLEQAKLTLDSSTLKILDNDFLDTISPLEYKHTKKDLSNLNAFYNGSFIRNKEKLNFGDIFLDATVSPEAYYLCVTPLCDCLHSEDNIDNNFFFVKGTIGNLDQCLDKGDTGFQSYLPNGNCIQWTQKDYIKPLQINIPERKISNERFIEGNHIIKGAFKPISLKYIFTLRQQYAQRIANHTFAYPLRVGVDFVKK